VRDGVAFAMLHPAPASGGTENDRSCVLRVAAGDQALLLPGDVEATGEAELLARAGPGLAAAVVVAPHHGSDSSSTPAFVAAVRADHVVYAAGYRNRWGFPAPSVAARWRAAGARAHDTAALGALHFGLAPDGVQGPRAERLARPRLWQRSP
jgi:competence protein ComEC